MIGPCCVLRVSAPPVSDSPPDAAAQRGAASDSPSSSNEGFGEGRGGSSSDDNEELEIVRIVGHRDTKGQPEDPVLNYCTVRFAELEAQDLGSEGEMELPESELLRRCPKLLREYRRGVRAAAASATSSSAEDDSTAEDQSAASGRSGGRARARPRARAWSAGEEAQVKRLGREQRGKQLGEAGFFGLAEELGRTAAAVYAKWMKIQTPQKERARRSGGAKQGRRAKKRRRKVRREEGAQVEEVEEELEEPAPSWQSSSNVAQLRNGLWQAQLEVASLRSQVFTLRECLGLLGMRGIDRQQGGERRGSYGGGAQAAHDPFFASQRMSGASSGY
jgi:hypothetical protein